MKTIIGSAGCGKTKYIIDYCINNSNKSDEFIIITYSKKIENLLLKKCKNINSSLFNNKNIKSINIFSNEIYKKLFNKSSSYNNIIIYSLYKNIINIDIKNIFKNLKFIIIYNAEELNYLQFNLIKLISDKLNIQLILIGDPNQNIFNLNNNSNIYLLDNDNIEYLNINYRSDNNIVNFCNELKPLKNILYNMIPFNNNNNNNNKPLIYCNNYNEIIKHIINQLNEFKLHDIAIISLYKNDLNLICNYLNNYNIKYIKHYEQQEQKENYLNILSSYDIKGLEFKKVLVLNYHYDINFTNDKYNYYKYLWYHIFTRAINKLIIYVENNKYIFPYINHVSLNLYNSEGSEIKFININYNNNLIFKNINIFETYNIKNINDLSSCKFNYIINKYKLYTNICNKYNDIYIKIIKEIFKYYYYKNNNKLNKYIIENINNLNNIVFLNNNNIYNSLLEKGIINDNVIYLEILNNVLYNNNNLNLLSYDELDFLIHCKKYNNNIIIILHDFNVNYIADLYNNLYKLENNELIIFNIFQYFNPNLNIEFTILEKYFYILNNLSLLYTNLEFNTFIKHINFNLFGIIFIIENNNKIIQFKFNNNFNINDNIIENLLYYNTLYITNNIKHIEIINIFDGSKYILNILDFNNWEFNYIISNLLNQKMNNNIIMFDLETNTKDLNLNFTDPTNSEIIDRYFYEYNWNYCLSQGFIKNNYNLTTSHITNIYEKDLINADKNLNNMSNDINLIFKYCHKPIFIAHNGIMFDLPILYHYNIIKPENIKVLDSLKFIKFIYNNNNIKSNKLIDLYNLICNDNIIQSHQAKEDTLLIVNICKQLNLTNNEFINLYGY